MSIGILIPYLLKYVGDFKLIHHKWSIPLEAYYNSKNYELQNTVYANRNNKSYILVEKPSINNVTS